MSEKTLLARRHPLAAPQEQVRLLNEEHPDMPHFSDVAGAAELLSEKPEILQVNLGYMCNQTCRHCHVDAGPDRREKISREVLIQVIEWLNTGRFNTLDLTGGAPEMHPDFRWLVQQAVLTPVREIIVRSNLTILLANPVYADLPQFFRDHKVRVCSSLPFHNSARTDRQRGEGVFEKSIIALKRLNAVGYGIPGTNLILDLVYNPAGAFLPGDQQELENEFKSILLRDYVVTFNRLLTITNVPVSRFLEFLITSGNYKAYMDKLVAAFNPATLAGLMCRNTVSVDWQGNLYDCDFNQMLGLPMNLADPRISAIHPEDLTSRRVITGRHCFACAAGSGSSCQGATV